MAPEDDLVEPNLVMQIEKLPQSERYSYIFNHNLQILDHILTTQMLDAYVTDVQFSRGDADALIAFETADGAMWLSDHDGLVVYIAP
jgi:predicted extracellular nuclease